MHGSVHVYEGERIDWEMMRMKVGKGGDSVMKRVKRWSQ